MDIRVRMEPTSVDITGPAPTVSDPIIIVFLATTIPTLVGLQVGLGVTGLGTKADTAPYSEDDSKYEALR